MVRRLIVQLLNVFTRVCFNAVYAIFFHRFVQVNFFGHHALALHQRFAIVGCANFQDFFNGQENC